MTEELKGKNGLPIRKGVLLFAGPDNPHNSIVWAYWVVDPALGRCICWNANNIYTWDPKDLQHYWVGEWRSLPQEKWFKKEFGSMDEDVLFASGLAAGDEDDRF